MRGHQYQFWDAPNFGSGNVKLKSDTAAVKGRVEMSCKVKHGRQMKINGTKSLEISMKIASINLSLYVQKGAHDESCLFTASMNQAVPSQPLCS